MTDRSLSELELEVIVAREKLATDLATLTAPSTAASFRKAVVDEAVAAKDNVVESVQDTVRARSDDFISALKAKAAANPVAVAAIGAGIAWRLLRNPPVTTALVGVGLYSLLNTDRNEEPFVRRHALDEKAVALGEQVTDLRHKASDMVDEARRTMHDWRDQAVATAERLTDSVRDRVEDAADRLAETRQELRHSAQHAGDVIADTGRQAVTAVRETVSDDASRDRMLLGVAGLAVATALGLAFQRRATDA